MKKETKILLVFAWFMSSVFFTPLSIWSQKSTKIDSLKLENGLAGHAMYEYVTKSGNEVLTGSFEFYQSQLDTENDEYAVGLSYEGEYLNDLKNGVWIYSQSRLKPSVLKRLDKTNIIYAGSGRRFGVYANFDQDIANGNWVAIEQEVDFGRAVDTFYFAKSAFEQGKMTGSFEAKKEELVVKGEINEEGFLNGNWITYHVSNAKTIEEHRVYENGVLIRHFLKMAGDEVKINHVGLGNPDNEDENWETITIDADYLDALFQTTYDKENKNLKESLNFIEETNKFLMYSIFSFGIQNGVELWHLNKSKSIQFPKIKVRVLPFSDEELLALQNANEMIAASLKIINEFLNDPIVDINRYNFKEVSMYYEIYKIYKTRLLKLKNTFDRLSLPSFKYIDKSEILAVLMKEGIQYPKMVMYEYQDKKQEVAYTFPEALSGKELSLENTAAHIALIYSRIQATEEKVNPIIEKNKKRAEIADKDKELVNLRDSIKDLFENKYEDDNYNEYHERYKTKIIDFSQSEFKNYAQKDIELRIERIDPLIDCFRSFVHFYTDLQEINEKILRVKEEYKRVVWNPFTYTDMEETVKERVYSAYEDKLLPHIFNVLESNITCKNITRKSSDFDELYNRMLELRQQDTRELERELRKTSSVEKIISLFKLNIQ